MRSILEKNTVSGSQRNEVILKAASAVPRQLAKSESGRRVEHTIRDEEMIFCYPTGTGEWINCVDSEFAKKFRGADPEFFGSVCEQSLGLPVFEKFNGQWSIGGEDQVSLAITKAYQYALMYPTVKFFLSELNLKNAKVDALEEILLQLRGAPENLLLSGRWQNRREEKLSIKKSARLAISGTAAGVNDEFVYEELEAEIEYLREEGYEDISLFHFGLYGIGNSRGDIRIPVCCAKLMKSADVDFYRVTFNREKYGTAPAGMYAYYCGWAATHVLHFTPKNSRSDFDFMGYYETLGIKARELVVYG